MMFYAYDMDGDSLVDDCAELGEVEAEALAAAQAEAARVWPGLQVRLVPVPVA